MARKKPERKYTINRPSRARSLYFYILKFLFFEGYDEAAGALFDHFSDLDGLTLKHLGFTPKEIQDRDFI